MTNELFGNQPCLETIKSIWDDDVNGNNKIQEVEDVVETVEPQFY